MCQHLQENILSVTLLFTFQLEAAARHKNVFSMLFHVGKAFMLNCVSCFAA